jgi:hypothetical protein
MPVFDWLHRNMPVFDWLLRNMPIIDWLHRNMPVFEITGMFEGHQSNTGLFLSTKAANQINVYF